MSKIRALNFFYRWNILFCVLSLAAFGGFLFRYRYDAAHLTAEARDRAIEQARQATEEISYALDKLVPVNIAISEDLTSGLLAKEDIVPRLKGDKTAHPSILGLGVAYVPYAYDPEVRLYAPLYVDREGGPVLVQIEDSYDYTEEGRDWYHLPLEKGPIWQEPHYGEASQAFLANFTSPFYTRDEDSGEIQPAGVVFSSMSLSQYREIAGSRDLGEGYAFILSRAGTFVSHPDQALVDNNTSITQWVAQWDTPSLSRFGEEILMGRRTFAEGRDQTGKVHWFFSEPIISTGWSVGVVLGRDNLVADLPAKRLLPMIVTGVLFLMFIASLLSRKTPLPVRS